MPFVIDASITMAWCFEDEATTATDTVLDRLADEEAFAPALWVLEVANVLLVAERRRRMTEAQASRFVEVLAQLPVRVDATAPEPTALLAAARRHRLSAYDAAYLTLAERLGLPLATLDTGLAEAAQSAGVPLLLTARLRNPP